MARQPLPDDALTWEQDGRQFVRFADDMFVYEYDENDRLARVPVDELPSGMPNPDLERLRGEIAAELASART
jgi:hypothetical protein